MFNTKQKNHANLQPAHFKGINRWLYTFELVMWFDHTGTIRINQIHWLHLSEANQPENNKNQPGSILVLSVMSNLSCRGFLRRFSLADGSLCVFVKCGLVKPCQTLNTGRVIRSDVPPHSCSTVQAKESLKSFPFRKASVQF